jgi:hypothetical protein
MENNRAAGEIGGQAERAIGGELLFDDRNRRVATDSIHLESNPLSVCTNFTGAPVRVRVDNTWNWK